MTSMNVSLPDSLREFAENEARSGGFSSVSEYLLELVRRAMSEKDLAARLQAALASRDAGELGPADFDRLRQLARGAAAKQK
ncbi:MAG TPA: type II toxin-antitoxin system ParD family antitoxin [Myxococcota bacterium]|nr:type II toxin-antitoxin system ParD family antitoxin [Myxococcota bacterium]